MGIVLRFLQITLRAVTLSNLTSLKGFIGIENHIVVVTVFQPMWQNLTGQHF